MLEKVREDIEYLKKLWTCVGRWKLKTAVWTSTSISSIILEKVSEELNEFSAAIGECARVMHNSRVVAYMKESLERV